MLKAGFIGFGRMGITHFSILNCHPDVKIAAVCDKSKTMLSVLEKYTGIITYTDHWEMLDKQALDFVVISTPTASHAEIIKGAIDRRLNIFCEKPFVQIVEEGELILKKLKTTPVTNQIGYVNRFNEVFVEVKMLLEIGLIGEIKNYSSEMYGPTVLKDTRGSWRSLKQSGGGCMFEFASHCIDLAIYLMGQPDKVIGSVLQNIYSTNVEDLVSATFIHKNGYTGNIKVNWSDAAYRKPTNIVTITGTKGKIAANKHEYKVFFVDEPFREGFHKGWNTRYITDIAESVRIYVRGNEFTRQLDYFVDCILRQQPAARSDFEEAFKTDVLMDKITRNAEGKDGSTDYRQFKSVKPPSCWQKIFRALK